MKTEPEHGTIQAYGWKNPQSWGSKDRQKQQQTYRLYMIIRGSPLFIGWYGHYGLQHVVSLRCSSIFGCFWFIIHTTRWFVQTLKFWGRWTNPIWTNRRWVFSVRPGLYLSHGLVAHGPGTTDAFDGCHAVWRAVASSLSVALEGKLGRVFVFCPNKCGKMYDSKPRLWFQRYFIFSSLLGEDFQFD